MCFLAKLWLCSKLADKDGLFGHDRPVNGRPATNQVSAQFLGVEQEATTLLAAENHSLTVADDYAAFVPALFCDDGVGVYGGEYSSGAEVGAA